jgi:hypothetical protein
VQAHLSLSPNRPIYTHYTKEFFPMLSADAIVEVQDEKTRIWHHQTPTPEEQLHNEPATGVTFDLAESWLPAVVRQHRANFELWHIEDEARAPGVTDAELAAVKRRIDWTNQRRNDLAEELDRALLDWLESRGLPNAQAPMNSESPGLIVDRLSILSLKIYHTREEADREYAPEGHAARNRNRLTILESQRADLAGCLDDLWHETLNCSRQFKAYRQLKMYNDPTLNPSIYSKMLKEPES